MTLTKRSATRSQRRVLRALLGVALALSLAACGESAGDASGSAAAQVEPPGPVDAGPGETVERNGVTFTVVEVGAAHSFDRRERAADGKVFIAARLSIRNMGAGIPAQGPDAIVLELPDGTLGKHWIVTPGSRLGDTGPPPGQELGAWRSWEVPEGTRAATISYKPTADTEIRVGFTLSDEVRDRWRVLSDLRHV